MSDTEQPGLAVTSTPTNTEILSTLKNTPKGEPWECPCCGRLLPFQSLSWLDELPVLVARYGGALGIAPDLAGLALIELHGIYLFLSGVGS